MFDETVSRELLAEQWDQMVRLTVSLKNRLAPPEVVVERLASAAPADRLAKALTAYGRIRGHEDGAERGLVRQLADRGQPLVDSGRAVLALFEEGKVRLHGSPKEGRSSLPFPIR